MKSTITSTFFIIASLFTALAAAGPVDIERDVTPASGSHLESRKTYIHGKGYCGIFANADGGMADSLVSKLNQGGLKTRKYTVAAKGCSRVQCWDTSGVYVCNDNSHSITLTGSTIHDVAQYVLNSCCMFNLKGDQINKSIMSGQQFTQWNWNVVVGYANCNADKTAKPSDLGGYGVNGGHCLRNTNNVITS